RLAAEWDNEGLTVEVAVNVSAAQFTTEFFEHLRQALARGGIKPGRLTVEITESQAIADVPAAASGLAQLRELGVDISIDDFGSGHSTVDQLVGLPATELKIDQSIVHEESSAARRMMEAVIGLVRQRGLRVVAEGVETMAQLELVRRFRCDRAQGFFIAPPMPRAAVERFISGHSAAGA
ncbi:MAG: EAL domain-containing protein, partial [Leifsonia sp.]